MSEKRGGQPTFRDHGSVRDYLILRTATDLRLQRYKIRVIYLTGEKTDASYFEIEADGSRFAVSVPRIEGSEGDDG